SPRRPPWSLAHSGIETNAASLSPRKAARATDSPVRGPQLASTRLPSGQSTGVDAGPGDLRAANGRAFDEHVDLLARIGVLCSRRQGVDDPQDARIDTLAGGAGQRALGNKQRLDVHERQPHALGGEPPQAGI